MPGELFDASNEPGASARTSPPGSRPFLGIQFACCTVYARIYPNHDQTAYVGHCPRCGRLVRIRIGPAGTGDRFFTVS